MHGWFGNEFNEETQDQKQYDRVSVMCPSCVSMCPSCASAVFATRSDVNWKQTARNHSTRLFQDHVCEYACTLCIQCMYSLYACILRIHCMHCMYALSLYVFIVCIYCHCMYSFFLFYWAGTGKQSILISTRMHGRKTTKQKHKK